MTNEQLAQFEIIVNKFHEAVLKMERILQDKKEHEDYLIHHVLPQTIERAIHNAMPSPRDNRYPGY